MRVAHIAMALVSVALTFSNVMAGHIKGRVEARGEGAVVAVRGVRGNFSPPKVATATWKEHFVINQKGMRFVPAILPVLVGSTVDFPNSEEVIYHHVWSPSPANRFDLGTYPAGETRSVSFKAPGIVEILCSIHTRMYGAVIVLDNPYFATVGQDGKYAIRGVPAGEHDVEVYISKNQQVITNRRKVVVPAQGEVELNF